jgi:hypothetical protein
VLPPRGYDRGMAAPAAGPCAQWVTDEQVRACCVGLDPDYDLTDVISFVSSTLFRLSGRRYTGECERTVRPCYGTNCGCTDTNWLEGDSRWWWDGYPFPTIPARLDGQWFNFGSCCGACRINCIEGLPAPITGVSEIVIDGDILASSAYEVRAFDSICRTDGGSWPCTNDLSEPSDAVLGMPGTWQITYTYGTPVPADAILPASIFACQVAKAACGATDCQLPARLKSIVRQGVAMAFADPMEFLDNGRVGIYEVDLWLRGVNPNGNMRAASIRRADDRRSIQTGWT